MFQLLSDLCNTLQQLAEQRSMNRDPLNEDLLVQNKTREPVAVRSHFLRLWEDLLLPGQLQDIRELFLMFPSHAGRREEIEQGESWVFCEWEKCGSGRKEVEGEMLMKKETVAEEPKNKPNRHLCGCFNKNSANLAKQYWNPIKCKVIV